MQETQEEAIDQHKKQEETKLGLAIANYAKADEKRKKKIEQANKIIKQNEDIHERTIMAMNLNDAKFSESSRIFFKMKQDEIKAKYSFN